jgi:hypothetical protein
MAIPVLEALETSEAMLEGVQAPYQISLSIPLPLMIPQAAFAEPIIPWRFPDLPEYLVCPLLAKAD